MTNLREQIEADLAETLEDSDEFGLPVILISPDGVEYDAVYGQILYDTRAYDEVGIEVLDHMPVVTVRRSSLTRVPLPDEKGTWAVKIPTTPSSTAATTTFLLGHASQDGGSIGFIRLYLSKAVQA